MINNMSHDARKPVFGVSNRSDTKWPVHSQKKDRLIEKELYYPCSEKKGSDQLHSYCKADLHLFHIGKNPFFLGRGSYTDKTINI